MISAYVLFDTDHSPRVRVLCQLQFFLLVDDSAHAL